MYIFLDLPLTYCLVLVDLHKSKCFRIGREVEGFPCAISHVYSLNPQTTLSGKDVIKNTEAGIL